MEQADYEDSCRLALSDNYYLVLNMKKLIENTTKALLINDPLTT